MAKQESILPIRGSLGDVTYFKRGNKYFCKKKNTFSLEQLRTDAAFAPFRRQGQISQGLCAADVVRAIDLQSTARECGRARGRESTACVHVE